jgi:hypothetical protein
MNSIYISIKLSLFIDTITQGYALLQTRHYSYTKTFAPTELKQQLT